MAVDQNLATLEEKPLIRDYWDKFQRRTGIIVTLVQSGFVFTFIVCLKAMDILNADWWLVAMIGVFAAAISSACAIALTFALARPLRDLVRAIVLVAGEPTALTPPNPNIPRYEKDGFRDILQTVYELASRDSPSSEPTTSDDTLTSGINNIKTGIVILDNQQKIIFSNKAAPVRTDQDGAQTLELFFPDDDSLQAWLKRTSKNKLTAERQWTRVSDKLPGEKSRRLFDVAASYRKNNPAETVLTLFDRTNIYTPEEDELDFISFAAHELRGPITVIRGYLDVLSEELQPKLEQDQVVLMQRLIVASNRLTSYVNNILNASRYDRRHFKLHISEDTIATIYNSVADDMQLRASAQNRVLAVDIPENLPTVAADNNAVGEVLSNLIDNAIKYSNEGGLVQVIARTVPGFVEVSVIDRGIGMPVSVLPNLFHKFYRSHRSRETVAGTGIGLYICKAIVASHGGSITARSIENEGSTFSFTLPIYDTVAAKLEANGNDNLALVEHGSGWIRNHSLYRG